MRGRNRAADVLVDTNLLLLYVVGVHDRDLIPRFKRTAAFTVQDFGILAETLDILGTSLPRPTFSPR